MSAHTPGPWLVEPTPKDKDPEFDFTDSPFWIVDADRLGEVLAVVNITSVGEAEANAHLIAAAPNLLRLARGAWHLCESLLAVRDGATDESIRAMSAALRSAIDEAEIGDRKLPDAAMNHRLEDPRRI